MQTPQTKFQTSFIPKKPVVTNSATSNKKGGIITLITTFVFVATLVAAGGVFFYKSTVESQIISQIEDLKRKNERFDHNVVARANRLNARINSIKLLLDRHKAPTLFFDLLEDNTLQSVRFQNLNYTTDESGNISVEARGVGQRYESVVLQSDQFGKTGVLRDVIFSSVQPTEDDIVTFVFQAKIDTQAVLYRKKFGTAEAPQNENNSNGNANESVSFNNLIKNYE